MRSGDSSSGGHRRSSTSKGRASRSRRGRQSEWRPPGGRNAASRASRPGSWGARASSASAARRSRRCEPAAAGSSSIGKSRLLNELRDLAERDGTGWLEGRCVSYGESLPYWPFRDLLRGEWIGAGAEEPELRVRVGLRRRLEQLFGAGADELYPYLGGLLEVALEHEASARTSPLSPEALQWRTFEVVGQLFARMSEDAPLVVALEDLHWADPTSVQLLEQLLSLAEDAPLLLVLSLRPERDHPAWGLREHAGREFPHLLREIAPAKLHEIQARKLDPIALKHAWIEMSDEAEAKITRLADTLPDTPIGVAFVDAAGKPRWIGDDQTLRHPVPPTLIREMPKIAAADRMPCKPGCHTALRIPTAVTAFQSG